MDQKILEPNIATKQRQNLTKATKETKITKATKERFHNPEKRHHLTSLYSQKEGDKDYKRYGGIPRETSLGKNN